MADDQRNDRTDVADGGVSLTTATKAGAATSKSHRRGPIDPRLVHYAHGTRRYLVLTVALGGCTAILVVAQAWFLATAVSGAFIDHKALSQLKVPVVLLFAAVLGRALVGWISERMADRASASAKSDLRQALVDRVAALGPSGLDGQAAGGLAVLATGGIDALDSYFSRYLPQVFLAVIVPITVIVVALGADWISAVIIAVTVPLIPIFMGLVGQSTKEKMGRQAAMLARLAGHFLDVVAGLPTLKVFGRAKAQAQAIGDITDQYRLATMDTLKVAFLSSLILELLATISVALVAVAVGLRLLGGHLGFSTALFVLILAPEAYLPLRLLGTNFHASAEGMKAAEDVFSVLDHPVPERGTGTELPDVAHCALEIEGLEVIYPGRDAAALRIGFADHRPGRNHRDRRTEWVRQVDPVGGTPRNDFADGGLGTRGRRETFGHRSRCVAHPGVMGAAATAPLCPHHCGERAVEPARCQRRRSPPRHHQGRPRRCRGPPAPGTGDRARYGGCGTLHRRAPTRGAGPGVSARRAHRAPRRADRQPRRPERRGDLELRARSLR